MIVKTLHEVSRLLHVSMDWLREQERQGKLERACHPEGYELRMIRDMVPHTKTINREVV